MGHIIEGNNLLISNVNAKFSVFSTFSFYFSFDLYKRFIIATLVGAWSQIVDTIVRPVNYTALITVLIMTDKLALSMLLVK